MSKEIRTSVRFPEPLHQTVLQVSKDEHRSFNAQVIKMMEDALKQRGICVERTTADEGGDS